MSPLLAELVRQSRLHGFGSYARILAETGTPGADYSLAIALAISVRVHAGRLPI